MDKTRSIDIGLAEAGCHASLHVTELNSGMDLDLRADEPAVMASVLKVPIALEFYTRVESGELDPRTVVELRPEAVTPGPVGISCFRDPARVSLWDLAYLMLTISDNAATDVIARHVGLNRVNARLHLCGCSATVIESDLQTMLDQFAADIGFANYPELLSAQSGSMGAIAHDRSKDDWRIDGSAVLDPLRASRTTARDMTRLLSAVWKDQATSPGACAALRAVMAQQVTRRMEAATPDGGLLAAKSGGLFGRIRNEIGVIQFPTGEHYVFGIFTRAHNAFRNVTSINAQMSKAVAEAIDVIRRH